MSILALRAVSLLLLVSLGSTFRLAKFKKVGRVRSEANESQGHLAWVSELSAQFEKAHASASKRVIILFRPSADDRRISDFCNKVVNEIMANGCLGRGSPSNGGFGFVVVDTWVSEELFERSKVDEEGFAVFSQYSIGGVDPDRAWSFLDSRSAGAEDASSAQPAGWLDRTGARSAQQRYSGKGVHVYVMDSGVRTSHEEFGGRAFGAVWSNDFSLVECSEWDRSNRACNSDATGHGTKVAGIAAGKTRGVAPEASIRAMKPGPELFDLYMHMDWLGQHAKMPAVLSVSIGFNTGPPAAGAENAINALVNGGVVVVVAAGNAGVDCSQISFAAHSQAIAVGAVDAENRRSTFSNYGNEVAIFAPGDNISSASYVYDGGFQAYSGTSMAAPQVSGAVALIMEANPNLNRSPAQVKELLVGMSSKVVVVNGKSRLNNLLNLTSLSPQPVPTPAPVEDEDYDFFGWLDGF